MSCPIFWDETITQSSIPSNWGDTTPLDSENDYHIGCPNATTVLFRTMITKTIMLHLSTITIKNSFNWKLAALAWCWLFQTNFCPPQQACNKEVAQCWSSASDYNIAAKFKCCTSFAYCFLNGPTPTPSIAALNVEDASQRQNVSGGIVRVHNK